MLGKRGVVAWGEGERERERLGGGAGGGKASRESQILPSIIMTTITRYLPPNEKLRT